jgi:hypothetical protein
VEEETIGDGSGASAGMVNTRLKRTEARFELLVTRRRDDDTGGFVWCSGCVWMQRRRIGWGRGRKQGAAGRG